MSIIINRPFEAGWQDWDERLLGMSAPNYIQWEGDSGTPSTGEISDGVQTFRNLYPNAHGVFSFDLSIFARNRMKRISGSTRPIVNVATTEPLSVKFSPTLKVNYADAATDTDTDNEIHFIAAYRVSKDLKKASFYEYGVHQVEMLATVDGLAMLPTTNIAKFNGYPLDCNIFHFEMGGALNDYIVYRVQDIDIFGGIYNIPEDYEGVLTVNLNDVTANKIDIYTAESGNAWRVKNSLKVYQEDKCGLYLRWLNSRGGWSYWLFEGRDVDASTADTGDIVQMWSADPFLNDSFSQTPKTREGRLRTATKITGWEIDHLKDLETSLNVYLYRLPKGSDFVNDDPLAWQRVKVAGYSLTPRKPSNVKTLAIDLSFGTEFTPQI